MGIETYSTTPASNTALFPEQMAPSAVNDGMRQVQADIRTALETLGYLKSGGTTFINPDKASVFKYFSDAQITDVSGDTGAVDVTAALQTALTAGGDIYFPAGTYSVDIASGGTDATFSVQYALNVVSNTRITMHPDAIIKLVDSALTSYAIFGVFEKSNVIIEGGQIIGDLDIHTGSTGEGGMGIYIAGSCNNIRVRDIEISKCWGDGVYTTQQNAGITDAPTNIYWERIDSHDHRRNCGSVTSCNRMWIVDCEWYNAGVTSGTAPEAGLDIEPNAGDIHVRHLFIINNTFHDNDGPGLLLTRANDAQIVMEDIHINGVEAYDNSGAGVSIGRIGDFTCSNVRTRANTLQGFSYSIDIAVAERDVQISNIFAKANGGVGVEINGSSANISFATIDNIVSINNTGIDIDINNVDKSHISNLLSEDGPGIDITNCDQTTFNSVHSENSTADGINIGSCTRCNFYGGSIIDASEIALDIVSASLYNIFRDFHILNPNTSAGTYDAVRITGSSTNNQVSGFTIVDGTGSARDFIRIDSGSNNNTIYDNDMSTDTPSGALITDSATGTRIYRNRGYNPVGDKGGISVGASPYTYTAGATPETVYIFGGTVSDVSVDSTTYATATGVTINLGPGEGVTVTYSSAPTMESYIH